MPGGTEWKKRYDAKYPGQFQVYSPYFYDATMMLADAMKRANSWDPKVYIPFLQKADRKSTRLNSSHLVISYAVFCLKKKKSANIAKRPKLYPASATSKAVIRRPTHPRDCSNSLRSKTRLSPDERDPMSYADSADTR